AVLTCQLCAGVRTLHRVWDILCLQIASAGPYRRGNDNFRGHCQAPNGVRRRRRECDGQPISSTGVIGMEPSSLTLFWAGAIALSIFVYVILDGFDLGVGVLFGTTNEEAKRVQMMNSMAPFWDGN